jgi:hypothetical protein
MTAQKGKDLLLKGGNIYGTEKREGGGPLDEQPTSA